MYNQSKFNLAFTCSFMTKTRILITCAKGIPVFLKQEILALGFPVLSENIAGIETEGTLNDSMRLNLLIRTGHRVLLLLQQFRAATADELYRALNAFPWEQYIPEDGYLCVTSSVDNATIRDSRFASLKCKDALVDRIKTTCGRRPDSGPERGRSVVHLHWKGEYCSVYLDTSGEPLSRRGYRKIPLEAPMQETLAAAVVLATGWNGAGAFINPMCGSGTLAVEAALLALNRAPGLLRTNFGFMHCKKFDAAFWDQLRNAIKKDARKAFTGKIIATDLNPAAVEAACKNAATAGVEHLIDFSVCPFEETPVPGGKGIVVMNPEYGKRMGEGGVLELTYKGIGDYFKRKCTGYKGYVFTGNPRLAKRVSLKANQSWQFFNSNIECRLLEYDLY